jgi:DNA-directed RNA polymerase specialized sigma24 family protein
MKRCRVRTRKSCYLRMPTGSIALEELPIEVREALVLRELEGLSYKETADVSGVPVGTVMSRLARARDRLKDALVRRIK